MSSTNYYCTCMLYMYTDTNVIRRNANKKYIYILLSLPCCRLHFAVHRLQNCRRQSSDAFQTNNRASFQSNLLLVYLYLHVTY